MGLLFLDQFLFHQRKLNFGLIFKLMRLMFLFLFVGIGHLSFCQDTISKPVTAKTDQIKVLRAVYANNFQLKGYRVQLFSGNKKQPAKTVKGKFISLYPDVKAHEIYQQPYFKIRVGDFRTKLEASKFKKEIAEHFPNAYIVKDNIAVEELVE